jgi:alpha-glucosidase
MLSFYKRLIGLRQREASLMHGSYIPVTATNQLLAFMRHQEGSDYFLVVLNMSHRPCYFSPKNVPVKGVIEIATHVEIEGSRVEGTLNLYGDEGMVIRLDAYENA